MNHLGGRVNQTILDLNCYINSIKNSRLESKVKSKAVIPTWLFTLIFH